MKKFAKILVVALTVCLIVGVMAVSTSAAVTRSNDAPGIITEKSFTTSATGNAGNSSYNCTSATNGVANYSHNGTSHGNTCPYGGSLSNLQSFLTGYKYATVDFDIYSDGYLKTEGDVISVDKDATSGKLAYRENIHISALLNSNGIYTHFAYFVSDGDRWYLSADAVYSEDDVALATEKNVLNHVTLLDDGKNIHLYLDGEHVSTTNTTFPGKTFCRVGLDVSGMSKEEAIKTGYSIKLANAVANKYSTDYESGTAYGLDEYIAAGDFNAPLYNCEDVVYSKGYTYTNPVAGQEVATIGSTNYYVLGAALDALDEMESDVTITTRKTISTYEIPSGIETLTVICKNGAEFTYSGAYEQEKRDNQDGTVTYILTKASSAAVITWTDANGNPIATTEAVAGADIIIPSAADSLFDSINGTLAIVWDANGSFEAVDLASAKIPEDVSEITIKPNVVSVTWKTTTDGTLATELYYVGSKIAAYDMSSFAALKTAGVEGWYDIAYERWADSEGVDFAEPTAEAEKTYVYTPKAIPVAVDATDNVSDFKVNVTFLDDCKFNVYWPYTNDPSISGISFYNQKKTEVAKSEVTLNDKLYFKSTVGSTVYYSVYGKPSFTLGFTVEYEGQSYEVEYSAQIGLQNYVKKALENCECGSTESKLLVGLANYVSSCYAYTNSAEGLWPTKIANDHKNCCMSKSIPTGKDQSLTYSTGLSGYKIAYAISVGNDKYPSRVDLVLYVPESKGDVTVSATLKGISGNEGNKTIELAFDSYGTDEGFKVYKSKAGVLGMYNTAQTITITVEGEATDVGTYNISDYVYEAYTAYTANPSDEAKKKEFDIIYGIYNFASAAYDYKTVGYEPAE